MQVCTIQVGNELYGIPISRVREILKQLRVEPVPLAPPAVAGLINLRGQIVMAIDLRKCIGLPNTTASGQGMNVVVDDRGQPVSLLVEAVGDVCEVDESLREPPPPNLEANARALVRAIYKLEGGQLLLLLDEQKALEVG